jgi:hypothetical protein
MEQSTPAKPVAQLSQLGKAQLAVKHLPLHVPVPFVPSLQVPCFASQVHFLEQSAPKSPGKQSAQLLSSPIANPLSHVLQVPPSGVEVVLHVPWAHVHGVVQLTPKFFPAHMSQSSDGPRTKLALQLPIAQCRLPSLPDSIAHLPWWQTHWSQSRIVQTSQSPVPGGATSFLPT